MFNCCFCGRFISYADFEAGKAGWQDGPYHGLSLEPPDQFPYHVACDLPAVVTDETREVRHGA